nr:NADH dehydrogenase subunit 4L [Orthomeria smaragdinum]
MYFMFFFIMFICGLLIFSFNYKHFLVTLLSLEYIILSLFFMLYMYLFFFFYDLFFLMIILTFWVCEGVLGLSLLVMLIRSYGNDFFSSYNILQC